MCTAALLAAYSALLAQYGEQLHRNQLYAMRGLGLAYAGRYKEAVAEALRAEVDQEVSEAVRYAEQAPDPNVADALKHVYATQAVGFP